MSEIFAPGSVSGPQGPAGAAGSLANVKGLTDSLLPNIGNLFNYAALQSNYITNSDGTITFHAPGSIGGGPPAATGMMYCPGATAMVCNCRIATAGFGPGAWIQLFDANGNYLGNATDPGGYVLVENTVFTLPGTQTYVRLTVGVGLGDWPGASTMIYASATGTPAIPGNFQPFGFDTIADVNVKDAVVAANAATNLLAGIRTSGALFAASAIAGPPLNLRNAFNWRAMQLLTQVNADGSLSASADHDTSTIYCPGATSFISNVPFEINDTAHNLCAYDAEGTFIANLNSTVTPTYGGGFFQSAGTVYPLPGTQTYVKFVTSSGHFNAGNATAGSGFATAPQYAVFYPGTVANPCPTSLNELNSSVPFLGTSSVNSRTATSLGANSNNSYDCTTLLNNFLATASSTNPIELILDGIFNVTGLVVSTNGYFELHLRYWRRCDCAQRL